MLAVISPAKTLDYETPPTIDEFTIPELLQHSEELIARCRQLAPDQIASLMKISDKLAGLNAARFQEWQPEFTPANAKQALLAFKGDVYEGMDATSFSAEDLIWAQDHLRILSGLYGLLKPLDLMQPYRLEMGTKLDTARGNNLYQFWGNIITEQLSKALSAQKDRVLINLASNEYFKSVKLKPLKAYVVTPVFKDLKNGQYKVISFYAKKARGMMARYILQNRLKSAEELKLFGEGGYYYSGTDSTEYEWVFKRDHG
jgi:cytoplasmic iron level regulating protein YaaA (DUF328/UPF0246 family)